MSITVKRLWIMNDRRSTSSYCTKCNFLHLRGVTAKTKVMSMLQFTFWAMALQQVVCQSATVRRTDSETQSAPTKLITFENRGDREQCTLKYRVFKKAYLRHVTRQDHIDYIKSYNGCFRECCYIKKFSCKSFSYFHLTKQCFLMNVTRHDEGVVLAPSEVHSHVEIIRPDTRTTSKAEVTSSPRRSSTAPFTQTQYGASTVIRANPTTYTMKNSQLLKTMASSRIGDDREPTDSTDSSVKIPKNTEGNVSTRNPATADDTSNDSAPVTSLSPKDFPELSSPSEDEILPDDLDNKQAGWSTSTIQTESAWSRNEPVDDKVLATKIPSVTQAIPDTNRWILTKESSLSANTIEPNTAESDPSQSATTLSLESSPTVFKSFSITSRQKKTTTTTQQSQIDNTAKIFSKFVMQQAKKRGSGNANRPRRIEKLMACGVECKNGGICKIFSKPPGTPYCQCHRGFKGVYCETADTDKQGITRISWWIILVISIAVILFFSVVGTFLVFYIYKRKMKTYNLTKTRPFELASAYSRDRIDNRMRPNFTLLASQNRLAQPTLRATDDANKSWIFCYFDDERRCESIYRLRTSK